MHLLRIFRCVCLVVIERRNMDDAELMSFTDALVNPKNSNSFGALYSVYRTAKDLVKRYGDVRIWNAESCHRPAGHESDPRSAVYVKTGKENALCTFAKLSSLVNATMNEQGHAMDELGIPQFTADLLSQVSDFHHSTPGSGLMTLNAHFWGKSRGDIEAAQLAVVRRFSNRAECEAALRTGKNVCLECLTGIVNCCNCFLLRADIISTGVVNHMGPGGQRMTELSAVNLLEEENKKRRMLRVFSSEICVIADYTKGEGLERTSDMEVSYWFGDVEVSCFILRIVSGMN
jgi:hypothetical protein